MAKSSSPLAFETGARRYKFPEACKSLGNWCFCEVFALLYNYNYKVRALRMNTKKLTFLFLSLLIFSLVLVGCQSSATTTMSTTAAAATTTAAGTSGAAGTTGAAGSTTAASMTVQLTAKNFSFSQTTITVKKGQKVKIELAVTEGMHDWVVDAFSARTKVVNANNTTSVEFVADKTGEYEYYCSVGNHRAQGMVGKLIVTD